MRKILFGNADLETHVDDEKASGASKKRRNLQEGPQRSNRDHAFELDINGALSSHADSASPLSPSTGGGKLVEVKFEHTKVKCEEQVMSLGLRTMGMRMT